MNVFKPEPNGSEWNIYDIIEDIQRLKNHFYNYSLIHGTRETFRFLARLNFS